jgi:hypothetical protein
MRVCGQRWNHDHFDRFCRTISAHYARIARAVIGLDSVRRRGDRMKGATVSRPTIALRRSQQRPQLIGFQVSLPIDNIGVCWLPLFLYGAGKQRDRGGNP